MNNTRDNVLLVITRGIVGGAPLSVLSLARELKRRGMAVTVAFGDGEFLADACRREGIPTLRPRTLRRTHNPLFALAFILEIKRLIEAGDYSVVHTNSTNALFAAIGAKLARTKPRTVFTFRGLSFLDEHAALPVFVKWLYRAIFKFLLRFVDEAVFVSRANLDAAKRMRLVRDGSVIYNGLDPDRLTFLERHDARAALAERAGVTLDDDTILLGSTGRLVMQKNYSFLIEQAAWLIQHYPQVRFIIIGEGEERSTLEALIAAHDLERYVLLPGEIAGASQFLKAFDVFVLPSRYEGFSMSLTEALFAGVPIVASNVGGASEQLAHAPEQVYPLNDAPAFRKALTTLIADEHLRDTLSRVNAARSREFTIERTARMYTAVYRHSTASVK